MKKIALAVVVIGALAAGVMYFRGSGGSAGNQTAGQGGAPGGGAGGFGGGGRGGRRGGGQGGFGGGQFGRPPMTVELGKATRASIKSATVSRLNRASSSSGNVGFVSNVARRSTKGSRFRPIT